MNTNAVAINGNLTEDGSAYLICDPHTPLSAPPHFQLVELSFGDNFVSGMSVPGVMGVIMGRTKHFAFGGTTSYIDNTDIWLEKVNEDLTKYFVDGEWKDIIRRTDRIKVKGGDTIEYELYFTHRGPLISLEMLQMQAHIKLPNMPEKAYFSVGQVDRFNPVDFKETYRLH